MIKFCIQASKVYTSELNNRSGLVFEISLKVPTPIYKIGFGTYLKVTNLVKDKILYSGFKSLHV